jgi:crotonobetainyl-CoA:carnitine CoA-transferase CaiB-like acyl-CoA transferase
MPGAGGRPAPVLGADTDEILTAAGIDPAECARLRAAGVI